jgi:beta-xylosidase/AraC-like DNA-binding protein
MQAIFCLFCHAIHILADKGMAMQQSGSDDYHIEIINVIDYSSRINNSISLLCLLKGSVDLVSEEQHIQMDAGDIEIVNQNVHYRLREKSDNVLLKISVSSHYFSRYFTEFPAYRFDIALTNNRNFVRILRNYIIRLVICHLQDSKECGLLEINSLLSDVLRILVLHFKQEVATRAGPQKDFSPRIEKIVQYVGAHYQQALSLNQLAKLHHVSASYLSRLFTLEVGVSFKTYLTRMRFKRCVSDLLHTAKPMYLIVQDNGFNDSRQFTSLFKKTYGMTPHRFRDEQRRGNRAPGPDFDFSTAEPARNIFGDIHSAELLSLLTSGLDSIQESARIQPLPTETVNINLVETPASPEVVPCQTYIVTIGKLDEILKKGIQQQILSLKEVLPLKYIEAHSLISGDTILPDFVSDEAFPSYSPYSNTDTAINFLKQQDIALLVRINSAHVKINADVYINKLLAFLCHCINVFGLSYISKWCFICYPESDVDGQPALFEACYLLLHEKIKALLLLNRIGVFYPFPADKAELAKVSFFRSRVTRKIDFLGYSVNPNEHVDFRRFNKDTFDESEYFVQRHTQNIVQQLKKHNLHFPLFLQAWNTLTGETRHTNGRFFRGALLLNTLLSLPAQVASLGLWINSETQHEALADTRIDISSLALFYLEQTKRPVFHVLHLRERLTGTVLARGKHYLVSHTERGYRILLFNSVTFNPWLSVQHHLLNSFKKQFELVVAGMESGMYQIKKRVFDQQNGALYRQFEQQNTFYGRDEEVIEYIERHASPSLCVYDEAINRRWSVTVEMDINAIYLFELSRVYQT